MIAKTLVIMMWMTSGQTAAPAQPSMVLWPESVDASVRAGLRCTNRPFGYSTAEMSHFPGQAHRLDYVARLFSDAPNIPREADRMARRMVAGGFEGTLKAAFEMLGARTWPGPPSDHDPAVAEPELKPADEASAKIWTELPLEVREAVLPLVRGLVDARPHVHRSFDWNVLAQRAGNAAVPDLGTAQVYDHAAAPWTRFGQWCPGSFAALDTFQPAELAQASALVSRAARQAIGRLCALDPEAALPEFELCRLQSPAGSICLLGSGDSTYRGGDAVVIDLGGNDRYVGRVGVPISKNAPIGVLIETRGHDVYDARNSAGGIACGVFGIGAVFDLSGNDQYYCRDSGLGCAWHGVGLLVDTAGDDLYSGNSWCEGAAHAGVGLLVDESGDDRYFCQLESQGLGSTRGVGILLDCRGNDRYHAYDNENGRRITFPSSQTRSHEASVVQGAGYGRRADAADGRSLAGGVGALVDGAGDDSYYGGVFSQGIGFWWSWGFLADLGGQDRYRGVYYAQGAAAHFAIGSLVDSEGNDQYNDRGILGQVLGAGRDGAIGTFVDSSGDDTYYIPKKSAGGGDMNGLGLFCDLLGKDTYYALGYANLGGASFSGGREYFRQFMPTSGLFVDLSGEDVYQGHGQARNNTQWQPQASAYVAGFGLDIETQPPPPPADKAIAKPAPDKATTAPAETAPAADRS